MRKIPPALLFGLAFFGVASTYSSAAASDWEEDSPPIRTNGMPPLAPSINKPQTTSVRVSTQQGQTPMLQGGATRARTLEDQPATISVLQAAAEQKDRQLSRIDGGAEAFLAGSAVNVITPPAVFKGWINQTHPGFSLSAENSVPSRVINVKGQWDDSTKPMHSLGIRHVSLREKDLRSVPLDGVKVIVVNCAGYVPKEALQRLRDFVGRGGYLITTDWALENTTARAFPGFICWSGEKTGNTITDAYVLDQDPTLFNGVPVKRATWKLDRGSQQIKILNPQRVKVLVRSSKMARRDVNLLAYPDKSYAGALAVVFSFGRGKVLHVISHYDNNADSFRANTLPDPIPEIGISLRQALITNFIVEALKNTATTSDSSIEN